MLGLGLLAWAIWRIPVFAGPILAYLVVWTLFARRKLDLPVRWAAAVATSGSIAFVLALWADAEEIVEAEQLQDLDVVLRDRWRLEERPSLAPPVAFAHRPNRFYLFAPGAGAAALAFEERERAALDLGHGLFRADWDPRVHGPISSTATLIIDGERHERALVAVHPTPHPRRLVPKPDRSFGAIVSQETDELILVRPDGTLDRYPTRDRPTDCAISGTSVVVVHESGTITLYDERGREKVARDLGAPLVRVATSEERVAVARTGASPAVHLLDVDLRPVGEVLLDFAPDWIALPSRDRILISGRRTRALHLARRSTDGWTVAEPIFLGRPVVTMAVRGDAAWAAITDYRPADDAGPNHHAEEQLVELDLAAWRIIRRLPTAPHGSPYAIDLEEEHVLVAFAGTDEVRRLDPKNGRFELVAQVDRPTGVARLGEVTAVTSAANGLVTIIDGPRRQELPLEAEAELTVAARLVRDGERAFYQSTRAGPSCQTCHLHGDSDYSLHDIGHQEPRPTLSTRGVAGTAPYLRGASYPSLAALEAFTAYVLGGYASPVPRRAEALAAYVATLPRPLPEEDASVDVLRRGNDAFVAAGCDFCHAYPAFTNLAQYPEGFLFPERSDQLHLLDTPSLIGAAAGAPYLYDGRADSLEAVLSDHNQANRHGDVKRLSSQEREALLRFLRSL